MFNRKSMFTVCAVVAAGLLMAATTQATTVHPLTRLNYLTFSKAVALPGIVLAAGAYTFEEGPGGVGRDVVLVRERVSQKPIYMGFTRPVTRPEGKPVNKAVAFGEAPKGAPMPIAVWFPVGDTTGHEFLYR